MPTPDIWVKVTIKRVMDDSAGLLDWILGGHHLVNEFLDEAEKWGRELGTREVVREYKPRV